MAAIKKVKRGWAVVHRITGKRVKAGGPFRSKAAARTRARAVCRKVMGPSCPVRVPVFKRKRG